MRMYRQFALTSVLSFPKQPHSYCSKEWPSGVAGRRTQDCGGRLNILGPEDELHSCNFVTNPKTSCYPGKAGDGPNSHAAFAQHCCLLVFPREKTSSSVPTRGALPRSRRLL